MSGKVFAPNADLGGDFERAPDGFVDYVLLNMDGRTVAVVEAKREGIKPLSGKEQARAYAERLGVTHIFLSNGRVHYYWNLRQGNPVKVSRFLPLEQLGEAAEWRPDARRLAAVAVDENYIAVSQDAAWLSYSPADRTTVMVNKKIRLLRDYQMDAIRELQEAVDAATTFCATRQVILPAIEQLVAGSLQRLQKLADAGDALISPDPLRREFLGHERIVNTLYGAVKPDPAALEFAGRVATGRWRARSAGFVPRLGHSD